MAMRVTGMNSGLDTESIIKELVAVKQTKVDDLKDDQTLLGWKQEAWKDINTKIYNLFNGTLNNLKYQGSFAKKATTVSDANAVSVITDGTAMDSVQSLKITNLAKAGYLTGGKLSGVDGQALSSGGKVLESLDGVSAGSFKITTDGKETTINVDENTTFSSLVTQLKSAGVNANFDAEQQRFYIGASKTGTKYDFELSDDTSNLLTSLKLTSTDANKQAGEDATIELNGVLYQGSENTIKVNGLTITCNKETAEGEEITLTTKNDTSGIYDMIKNFIKEYSSVINEIDKLYNAASAKDYDPLSDEEKETMSEAEIEKWETKIKDSLLRRDSTLSTVGSTMKEIMSAGFEVDGKTMYLYDFGIETLGYFNAADNEKNAYHIHGDADDTAVKNETNDLLAMINSDPDKVIDFFTQLSQTLSEKLNKLMATSEYSSVNKVYDDKKMKLDYDDYTTKIKEAEEKLTDYENKWYKKFGAMETALAKMQSNASAVTGLLGGS